MLRRPFRLQPRSFRPATVVAGLGAALVLTACSAPLQPRTPADRGTPPELGACYALTPRDTQAPSSASEPVPCSGPHTAETFAIGTLPATTGDSYDAADHGRWIFPRCERAFEKFLAIDDSLSLRVQLSWAWFRPSERGWEDGARWYRCDLVGGPADAQTFRALPTTGKGLFAAKPPDEWLTCARGQSVAGSTEVPCSEPHDWRAVTTIKLGQPTDKYPGDRLVQVTTRDYCSDSVGAWMNYPVDYEFGYTWFHEAEWQAGNRRSVCWARTDQ